jgi:soluble lytic murein transglycosylase-like protein
VNAAGHGVGGRWLALCMAVASVWLPPAPAAAGPLDHWYSQVARASARFGVPEAWIRQVMRVESGGRAQRNGLPIVSRAGAMGLMQLMPGTWTDMQRLLGLGSDPFDPNDNILAGTAYLRLMYDRFGYPGMFAAYNAGPARYSAFVAGVRPLPAETRAYVAAASGTVPASRRRDDAWLSSGVFVARSAPAPMQSLPASLAPSPRAGLFVALAGTGGR